MGGWHRVNNVGGYQVNGLQITVGGGSRSVSVRSGGNRVGVLPCRASSSQGQQVGKNSYVNMNSVQDGMKATTGREKVYKETAGGHVVFGPRVEQLLEGRVYGLFSSQMEKMYEKKWEEVLPSDWCNRLSTSGVLKVDQQNGQMLVFLGSDIEGNLQQQFTKNIFTQPPPMYTSPPVTSQYPYPPPQPTCYKTPERSSVPNENLPLACSTLTEVHSSRQMYRQPPPFLPSPRVHPTQEGHANNQFLTSLPPLPFPRGSNWDISVCLVTSSNQIYFQFNDNMERLEELVTSMDEFYTTNSVPLGRSEMCAELVCCANVEGGFYRVQILDIQDEGICSCLFLDIGLENQVDCDDLQELPLQFQQLPGQAVPACLAKVEHGEEKDVLEFVTKCLDGESFVALVDNREELGDFCMEDQEVPFLFLMDSNCSNMAVEINKFIVKSSSRSLVNDSNNNKRQGLLLSSSDLYPAIPSSKSPNISLCTPISKSINSSLVPEVSSSIFSSPDNSSLALQVHCGPLPSAPLPTLRNLYDLTVVHATGPDQFQIVSYSQKVAYAVLLSQMTGYYNHLSNHTPVTDDHLRVGSILAFSDSSAWQRAKVVRVVNLHPLAVALKLVDQGCFKACTSPDDLQPLGERFAQLPSQAIAARLDDMQAGVGGWGEEVLDWFREVTVGRDFVARVKDSVKNASQEDVLVMDLIDTSKPQIDVNINKEVMFRQLVWRSRIGL